MLPPQVEEAGHVFLLMKKDYRISRNVRLAWVLSRLHQVIRAVPEPELVSWCSGLAGVTEPLLLQRSAAPAPCTALSPVPGFDSSLARLDVFSRTVCLFGQVKSENELDVLSILPNGWQPDEPVQPRPYLLVPSTRVTFLARQYRFVIELDLSPSTGIVVRAETASLWGVLH